MKQKLAQNSDHFDGAWVSYHIVMTVIETSSFQSTTLLSRSGQSREFCSLACQVGSSGSVPGYSVGWYLSG